MRSQPASLCYYSCLPQGRRTRPSLVIRAAGNIPINRTRAGLRRGGILKRTLYLGRTAVVAGSRPQLRNVTPVLVPKRACVHGVAALGAGSSWSTKRRSEFGLFVRRQSSGP